jgi:chemotaxis protein CheC
VIANLLNPDQREALQEIANIGMGQAGDSIARVMGEFVQLSVPRILALDPQEAGAAIARTVGEGPVDAVRQAFHSQLRGEAIVIYGHERCNDLADLLGYDSQVDTAVEQEMLLDVTNLLVGACLGGIAEQLKTDIGFSPPSFMAERVAVASLLKHDEIDWDCALLVEVNFRLESRSFACHLLILLTGEDVASLCAALDRFLEAF